MTSNQLDIAICDIKTIFPLISEQKFTIIQIHHNFLYMKSDSIVPAERIESRILIIRGQRVMLDQDLAVLYEVETKALNQAVKRNINRFPDDFAFRLTNEEWKCLRSQFATSKPESETLRSQFVTSKNETRGGRQYFPTAFTEHGALMLANILRSDRAAQMSIEVIRAFIHLRRTSASHEALAKESKEIKSFVLKHAQKSDQEFRRVWNAIEKLSAPPAEERRIGFRVD